jgi:hypothetical protein
MLRFLWLVLAVTFPLFAVEFLRFNDETVRIHVAVPMVVLALALAIGCASLIAGAVRGVETGWCVLPKSRWERTVVGVAACFVAWHVVGWMRAEEWVLPTRELVKVAFGAFSVWGILTFFPRQRGFLEQFWKVVLGASALLAAVLIAEYALVFDYPFLGNQLGGVPNSYSIQLAWYLTPILLHSIFYYPEARRRWLAFLALFVFATGWLYISSRTAWIAVLVGLVVGIRGAGARRGIGYAAAFAAAAASGALLLQAIVSVELAFFRRALFLISPSSVPELHTYEVRYGLVEATWSCFKRSPLIGIGLDETDRCINFATHNDYIKILADLGVVGLGVFMMVLTAIGMIVLRDPDNRSGTSEWMCRGSRASLVAMAITLFFHNIYTTTFFWVLVGLLCIEAGSREAVVSAISHAAETGHTVALLRGEGPAHGSA